MKSHWSVVLFVIIAMMLVGCSDDDDNNESSSESSSVTGSWSGGWTNTDGLTGGGISFLVEESRSDGLSGSMTFLNLDGSCGNFLGIQSGENISLEYNGIDNENNIGIDATLQNDDYITGTFTVNSGRDSGTRGNFWLYKFNQNINENLGFIEGAAINYAQPNNLYLATSSGVYKSTDGGENWSQAISLMGTLSIAIDPANPETLYVGTIAFGLYKSEDSGASWRFTSPNVFSTIQGITINPEDTNNIYLATVTGVYKTLDGLNFTPVNAGITNLNISTIAIDSTNTDVLYAASEGGGVFKSTNAGSSWDAVNSGLDNLFVHELIISDDNSQAIFAGTQQGIFQTTNAGADWGILNENVNEAWVTSSTFAPDGTLYVGTRNFGVLKADDSFDFINTSAGMDLVYLELTNIFVDPTSTNVLYASTTGKGMFKSTDQGASWLPINNGLDTTLIVSNVVVAPSTIYATAWGAGILKSVDDGETWEINNVGLTDTEGYDILVDPEDSSTLYAALLGGTFKTTNGGKTWENLGAETFTSTAVEIDAENSQNVFVCTMSGIFSSNDGGASWNSISTGLPPRIVSFGFKYDSAGQNLYLGILGPGMYKSEDLTTWNPINTGITDTTMYTLDIAPSTSGGEQVLYAGTFLGELYRSTDAGTTWISRQLGLPSTATIAGLKVDPENSDIVYCSTTFGLYATTNAGESWARVNGSPEHGVIGVSISSLDNQKLYISSPKGLYTLGVDLSQASPILNDDHPQATLPRSIPTRYYWQN